MSAVLRPASPADAEALYPLACDPAVTDHLRWDGPESLAEFRQGLAERAAAMAAGQRRVFTIVEEATGAPIGLASTRLGADGLAGELGLWVGRPYQGRGVGTRIVWFLLQDGFEGVGRERLYADVFQGNMASRRIMEKNGLRSGAVVPEAVRKGGQLRACWRFEQTRAEFLGRTYPLLHICAAADWEAAQRDGAYRAASLASEGFIHLSTPVQVAATAARYYAGQTGLVLLQLEAALLDNLRWENSGPGVFPHVYGPLPLASVTAATPLMPDAAGGFPALAGWSGQQRRFGGTIAP
jgi:uncharacterized protein (DUF952 family)/RimJ/RimL family protein N-acetyltransferase